VRAELGEVDVPAEVLRQLGAEHRDESGLGHLACLELEEHVLALALGEPAHRRADVLLVEAVPRVHGLEGVPQRRREYAAEVADDGRDLLAHGALRRTS